MNNLRKLTLFDFDGTLTKKDSMMAIIIFHCGRIGLVWALLRQLHLIVLMLLKLYSNQKCKERLLAYCFGGMTEEEFHDMCKAFASSHAHIMREEMKDKLHKAMAEGEALVITASPAEWVSLFVPNVRVLGSSMEVVEGRITGRLIGKNCYGEEKVNRLLEAMPEISENRSSYFITAYGDSNGDTQMLAFADRGIKIDKTRT